MTTQKLEFTVGSATDRDDLVADFFSDDRQVAQLTQESGDFEIEVYCNPAGGVWAFRLDELMALISSARDRLVQLRRN